MARRHTPTPTWTNNPIPPPPTNRAPKPPARPWYTIEDTRPLDPHNARRGTTTDVYLYNEIGYWGVTADDFVDALKDIDTTRINLHINSPGGSVFDGVSIYNALRDHPARVDTIIDGVAASAASFIAQAGDSITMNRGSEMMVHNAHGLAAGDSNTMREMVDILDRQNTKIAKIYASQAGGTLDHWLAAMDAETWYDPEEAVAAGLATKAVIDHDGADTPKSARASAESMLWAQYKFGSRADAGPPAMWDPTPEPEAKLEPVVEAGAASQVEANSDLGGLSDAELVAAVRQAIDNHQPPPPPPDNTERAARLRSAFSHLGAS